MSKQYITHVYSAKNALHIREMVPANEMVFNGCINVALSVCADAPFFASNTIKDGKGVPVVAHRWWRTLATIITNPSNIVIYHGGYWPKIWWVVLFGSFFCSRQIFINWGGELLPSAASKGKYSIRYIVKSIAVRRLFAVVFLSKSDADLGMMAHPEIRHHDVIPYFNERHSRRVDRQQAGKIPRRQGASCVVFQVGNDASEANDHLACLKHFISMDMKKKFLFPMNYNRNSEEYIENVLNFAKSMLYSHVEVIEEMLSADGFDEIIERCDVLLVGSQNQRSLYSIYAYLSSGKAVFLPEDSKSRRDLIEAGFEIEALESISEMTPEVLMRCVCHFNLKNVMRVHEILGLAAIRGKWDLLLRRASAKGAVAVRGAL